MASVGILVEYQPDEDWEDFADRLGQYCYESGSHLHTDRQQPPEFRYFDKYVFIVRVPSFCLMGITCVHCEVSL